MTSIGFIGLGSLGAPIARRIAGRGFSLGVYDIDPAAMAGLATAGVTAHDSPVALARAADILAVCVRMDADLVDLTRDGALFAALGAGGLFVIHSTVAPDLCRALAEQARPYGVGVIDAGVSGGAPAARKGELSLFVGGADADVAKARPLLESCGRIAHLGPVGRGMEGKLLNNLVSIANYGMAAAILDLGEELGFDRVVLRETLLAGSAEGFALRAVPGLLRPEAAGPLRQLLGKDVDHARVLAPATLPAMAVLTAAADAMLARLERAAG